MSEERFQPVISPTVRRQLTENLPEPIAVAAYDLIVGPLLDNPHRGGRRLRPPLDNRHSARRGTYRVIYRIDDEHRLVTVVGIARKARMRKPARLPKGNAVLAPHFNSGGGGI